jgi:hypothetical protein
LEDAEMEGLTEGRIVHYTLDETEHRPAIVVKVWRTADGQPPENGMCNLQVFTDGQNDHYHNEHLPFGFEKGIAWCTSILYSEKKEPGTWHWIEKA